VSPGLCSCAAPDPKTVPTYIKQNESDALTLDLNSIGMSPDTFPTERYAPIGILGDGSRASVILARDKQRGTKVAVKCFKRIAPALRSTFESEVRKNKELNHTDLAKIVDFGFHKEKSPYLVSEYKDGFNLEQCLALYGIPSHDVAVKILIGVCEALLYAQKQTVLHRDIRPANIVFLDDMNSDPSISVLDFALPKIKMSEEVTEICDALYMSADEARRLEYTEHSEVYSLGCVGFALLTGRPPFQDDTALDIRNSHALKLPPRISVLNFDATRPGDLDEVIEKCLEKDPRCRFGSISELLERLQVFPRREQLKIAAVLAAKARKKIVMALAVFFLIAAFGAGILFALSHH
jgi:eukaryotic-like serine/threonine-protein kinase